MRPSTPSTSPNAGFGPLLQPTHPSSPPYTPTTPTFHHSSPSPPETPSRNQRRRAQNFSRPLPSQPRGSENRYAPLTWQDLAKNEGGGYIQPLGIGTNKFSYIPASRGRPDDPSLSPRSSSPEPSEDDDDDDHSSVSPRSLTDDDEFVEKETLPILSLKNQKSGEEIDNELSNEEGDMEIIQDKGNRYDRGRRRRSTIKAKTNFVLEEMPSRSQERDPRDLMNSNKESLPIIQPDQYSDAETAPSRSHSTDIHNYKNSTNPNNKPTYSTTSFRISENGTVETDTTTDTDANPTTLDPKIMESLSTLNCESEEDDREAWLRRKRQEKRQKRWSLGSQKRSITQSIGSGTDEEDLHGDGISVVGGGGGGGVSGGAGGGGDEGGVAVGGSARRLRRRTGVGAERPNLKRSSLLFEDPPKRIVEVDEPESDFGGGGGGGGWEGGVGGGGGADGEERVRGLEVEPVMDDELPYFVGGWEEEGEGGDVDMDA